MVDTKIRKKLNLLQTMMMPVLVSCNVVVESAGKEIRTRAVPF